MANGARPTLNVVGSQVVVRSRWRCTSPSSTNQELYEFPLETEPPFEIWHGHPEDFVIAAVQTGADLLRANPWMDDVETGRWYVVGCSSKHPCAKGDGPACVIAPLVLPIHPEDLCVIYPVFFGDLQVIRQQEQIYAEIHRQ